MDIKCSGRARAHYGSNNISRCCPAMQINNGSLLMESHNKRETRVWPYLLRPKTPRLLEVPFLKGLDSALSLSRSRMFGARGTGQPFRTGSWGPADTVLFKSEHSSCTGCPCHHNLGAPDGSAQKKNASARVFLFRFLFCQMFSFLFIRLFLFLRVPPLD